MRRWIFFGVFAASLLPFIHRPWLFDDPSVIITARAAMRAPWRPYDYSMDLGAPDRPIWLPGEGPAYTHPPFSAWVLGGAMTFFGEHEAVLHLTVWLFMFAATALGKKIAQILDVDDEFLGYLFAFSPVIFLSSLTLYPHVFYFTFYLLSLWIALRINRGAGMGWVAALGASLALASVSLDHWPILVVLVGFILWRPSVLKAQRWIPRIVPFAIFGTLAGAWSLWEIHIYGTSHFWANFHVRTHGSYPWQAAVLPSIFMAGGLPFIVVGWPFLFRRSKIAFGSAICLAFGAWGLFCSHQGGFTLCQGGLLSLELSTGLVFLMGIGFLWMEPAPPLVRLIAGWLLLEFLFVQKFLTYPSGHHLLMMALPATLLTGQMVKRLAWSARTKSWGCVAMMILTLALAHADYEEAKIGPRLVHDVSVLSGRRYYWGNDFSGFCYYLKMAGWQAYDPRIPLKPGEFLLVPRNFNVQGPPRFLTGSGLRLLGTQSYWVSSPLRTFSLEDSAGWYSASWGALPYSFSTGPAETFYLYSRP